VTQRTIDLVFRKLSHSFVPRMWVAPAFEPPRILHYFLGPRLRCRNQFSGEISTSQPTNEVIALCENV